MVEKQARSDFHDAETENQNASFVSRYVECLSGATFAVKLEINKNFVFKSESIGCYVYVDGTLANSNLVYPSQVRKASHVYIHRVSGATHREGNDRWEFRPFIFGEIKHVEEASEASDQITDIFHRNDLGSIVVKAYHVKAKASNIMYPLPPESTRLPTHSLTLWEKQLKGSNLTHTAQYGIKQDAAARQIIEVEFIDRALPFATFQFKYRSKEVLQSLLLIRRPPSPIPLERRPIESLSMEEMRTLLQRQRGNPKVELQSKGKLESTLEEQRIKHEQDVKSEQSVKRERDEELDEILASAYVKKARTAETVDLSHD